MLADVILGPLPWCEVQVTDSMNLVTRGRANRGSSIMWLRQYSVHEILSLRDVRRCRQFLGAALAAVSQHQVAHSSHDKRPHLGKRQTNFYDVLNISPKATQAQVKDAYYKLSKKYHPDQYKGKEDPAMKFREIKDAYEVIGNFNQRKMYDKGLLGMSAAVTPDEAEEYSAKFYESRRKKGAVPTASGRTPIYNFDEWSKQHYESSRTRRENAKMRYEELVREREVDVEKKRTQSLVSCLVLCCLMFVIHSLSYGNDSGKTKKKVSNNK